MGNTTPLVITFTSTKLGLKNAFHHNLIFHQETDNSEILRAFL